MFRLFCSAALTSKVLLAKIVETTSRIPHSDVNRLLAVKEDGIEMNGLLDKFFLSINKVFETLVKDVANN